MDAEALRARAARWAATDPDPDDAATVRRWLADDDLDALLAAFGEPLAFGTAGLRGPLGPGAARMNLAVVRRITAGLAERLRREPRAAERGVVVAGDHRHGSQAFADDAAAVLAGAGLPAYRLPGPVPTPLAAFAVRRLDAAAGVVITASHNPPADNGYKVYWGDGAQIRPPVDAEIAAAADAVTDPAAVPRDAAAVRRVDGLLADAFLDSCARLATSPPPAAVRIVHTALHGVAGATCLAALRAAGFTDLHEVAEQAEPDPDFPTVAFPNPEEPGALDLALAEARALDADLLLANDPDGDRIAVAVPQPEGDGSAAGGWRVLSGDEAGCVLADHLLARHGGADAAVATTVVSSRLLAAVAAAHGAEHVETLTGFKWLAPVADDVAAHGRRLLLAYEQALGIMVTPEVRDKDGIGAAVAVADLAAHRAATGSSIPAALEELARAHGLHHTGGRNRRLDPAGGAGRAAGVLAALRAEPPEQLAGVPVVAVDDRLDRQRRHADGRVEPLGTPVTDLLGLELADGARVQARPSGTEPLLKCYGEVIEPVADDEPVSAARRRAEQRLTELLDDFVARLDALDAVTGR